MNSIEKSAGFSQWSDPAITKSVLTSEPVDGNICHRKHVVYTYKRRSVDELGGNRQRSFPPQLQKALVAANEKSTTENG